MSAPASCKDSTLFFQQPATGPAPGGVPSGNLLLEFDLRVVGTTCPASFGSIGVGTPQLLQLGCNNSMLSLTEQAVIPPAQFPTLFTYSLGTTLTEGVWHHFRFLELGNDLTIWIDGNQVFKNAMHSTPTADARLLSLGGSVASVSVGYDNIVFSCPL